MYINKIRSITQIENSNQVLLDSTLTKSVAPKIPQAALKADDNVLKMAPARTIHCFKSALALLQQNARAHPKKILTNGTMNKTKIDTFIHTTTKWFHASDVAHKLEVKAQIDHGITRASDIKARTNEMHPKHLLFSPK